MIAVFEDAQAMDLAPLTLWRPAWDLRCGIRTLLEKVLIAYDREPMVLWGRPEMADVVAARGDTLNGSIDGSAGGCVLFVNGCALLRQKVPVVGPPEVAVQGDRVVYLRLPADQAAQLALEDLVAKSPSGEPAAWERFQPAPVKADAALVRHSWDLVAQNVKEIESDFRGLWSGYRHANCVDAGAVLMNEGAIQIGRGARVKPLAVLDAENGPISIGRNAIVSPHAYIQGPASIGDGSLVQPGSVIRMGSSIGPVCKVGGEIEESILIGYSNKQHDGFLGHSVVGEWCNLGAGTTNSDLKNTYGSIRVTWRGKTIETGRMFVGVTMGDHSKTAIGTRIVTGAVVGVCCNILVPQCPKTVADFTWLSEQGSVRYDIEAAISVARKVMSRRGRELSKPEIDLFRRVAAASQ